MANLVTLQQTLNIYFRDLTLLEQALVHSSYLNEPPGANLTSNERLEFLGDAILGWVIAEKLYYEYPQDSEGKLTKLRASLVRQDSLAHVARKIKLGSYLYLGKGEESGGGRDKPANLAGALEALIAAVFLDKGPEAARELVYHLFGTELENPAGQAGGEDYKSQLQEVIQARQQTAPSYYVIAESGPAHARQFTVEVRVGDKVLGRGVGQSKKVAEQEAARAALSYTAFTP